MKQRIIPAEPTAEQIERGRQWCVFPERAYAAMTENCTEVSGEPVGEVRRVHAGGRTRGIGLCNEAVIYAAEKLTPGDRLYTTPQPDPRDAEIARLRDAAKVALEAIDELMYSNTEKAQRLGSAAITALKGAIE